MHIIKFWGLILAGLFLALPAFAADDEDSGIENRQVYHVYKDIDLIPDTYIQYGKPKIVVKTIYPLLTSDEENESVNKFNQLVHDLIHKEITNFKKNLSEVLANQKDIPKSLLQKAENNLDIDFDSSIININSKPIVSIRFIVNGYIVSMAHPYHHHRVINYDLENGQTLELTDIFNVHSNYLEALSKYSSNVLYKRYKDQLWIEEGTAPQLQNYKNWNVNPFGLLITFDEYQVGPYHYGSPTVLIPYSILRDFISQESLMGECLKHQKKCLKSHLLTGGFMDEASKPRKNADIA